MKKFLSFFRLIRVVNLLFMAVMQYMVLYCLVKPSLQYHYSHILGVPISTPLAPFDFFLLVMSSLCIAAAGFIVNDINDVDIDRINKPHKVIVGEHISLATANAWYWILNVVGASLGFYISWTVDMFNVGFIFVFCIGLLWFYSTNFSKEPLVGNIIVALLVALLPLVVVIFEVTPLNYLYVDVLRSFYMNFNSIVYWALGVSFFAFLTNLIREIVKDTQDLEGDCAYGRNTLPVAVGVKNTKRVVFGLLVLLVVSLATVCCTVITDIMSRVYLSVFCILPSVLLMVLLLRAHQTRHYRLMSIVLKIIMLMGVMYLGLVWYNFKYMTL